MFFLVSPSVNFLHLRAMYHPFPSASRSNVPDYISPAKKFHALAAACSAPHTVHTMHSMNWPCITKGACHLDFHIVDFERSPEVGLLVVREGRSQGRGYVDMKSSQRE